MLFRRHTPPLGSPENPEIILPGEKPHLHPSKIRRSLQILGWMFAITLPALAFDTAVFWLWEAGRAQGLWWLLLILLLPPALIATLSAFVGNLVLTVIFFANLLGRADIRIASR